MTTIKSCAALTLLALLAGLLPQPAVAADSFYTRLLERGVRDLELGLADEAQRRLRTACFGFLDEPVLLAEGLMQLGRAQAAAGNTADLIETAERLAEIEDRFSAYSDFEGDLKPVFESSLKRALPETTLARFPVFIHLTATTAAGETQAKPLTPKQQRKALERAARKIERASGSPNPLTEELVVLETEPPPAVEIGAAETPAPATGPEAAKVKIGLTLEERMRRVRAQVAASRFREQLEEARQRSIELADENPDSTAAQHLAAQVAYMSSEWQAVVDYFDRGGRPSADRPELLFYLAVANYELGNAQLADSILREALPELPKNAFVNGYIDKILAVSDSRESAPGVS